MRGARTEAVKSELDKYFEDRIKCVHNQTTVNSGNLFGQWF